MKKMIKGNEVGEHIGFYFVSYMDELDGEKFPFEKVPCKILEVQTKEKIIVSEICGGSNKGSIMESGYQELCDIYVYDEDDLVLALLQAGENK